MSLSETQIDLLKRFEHGLDPRFPERGRIPARVLGYGEISTVFEIQADGLEDLAVKRLPLFREWPEAERYEATLDAYVGVLTGEVGLRLPRHRHVCFQRPSGLPVVYILQDKVREDWLCHRVLHRLPSEGVQALVLAVLRHLRKVWDFNARQDHMRVAIDGQLSNWAIEGPDLDHLRPEEVSLTYLDTSTPLFRVDGVEQLDPELFLRSAPSFLSWILRLVFLEDVVDRYYDFRRVVLDLVANLYKEQRPEMIPGSLDVANRYFADEAADLGILPVTEEQVRGYYREDALIWRMYLSMRKVDRWLRSSLLRREYPYILPDKVLR
ncbi:MAG TPA: DUF6206 family protein [Anaerolineae bacterium]|nr:DUF6206 family protein [Anaerolineae bacterium]